jgi:hypothetical protein
MKMPKTSDLSDKCRLALGDLVVAFNDVEKLVKDFIGYLLNISSIEAEVVAFNLHLPALLPRLYALYEIQVCHDERQKKLSEVVKELYICNQKRNDFIHGEWVLGYNNNDFPIFSKPQINDRYKTNPPDLSLRFVNPDEIIALTNKLRRHEYDLNRIKTELKGFRHMNPPPDFLVHWPSQDER